MPAKDHDKQAIERETKAALTGQQPHRLLHSNGRS